MRTNHLQSRLFMTLLVVWVGLIGAVPGSQTPALAAQSPAQSGSPSMGADGLPVVSAYLIGIGDSLSVRVWREPDVSADVVVGPDGKIALPLINEVEVLGLTVEALRAKVTELLVQSNFLAEPVVSVIPIAINSRQVFITGMVAKPGTYPILAPTTVIQLIAMAGGLLDFADEKNIVVVRATEIRPDGVPWSYVVNYEEITKRLNLKQNIFLMPGDTVIVR